MANIDVTIAPASLTLRGHSLGVRSSVETTDLVGECVIYQNGDLVNHGKGGARLTLSVNETGKLDFNVLKFYGTGVPERDDDITMFVRGTKRFSGRVLSIDREGVDASVDRAVMTVHCEDYNSLLDEAVVNHLYNVSTIGGLISVILYDLWQRHLQPLGVSHVYQEAGDPAVLLPAMLFKCITLREACNMMLKSAPGWSIWIDKDKVLHLRPTAVGGSSTAPFDITEDSDNWAYLKNTTNLAKRINRQWVLPSKDIFNQYVETFDDTTYPAVDGVNFAFPTTYPVHDPPNVTVDTGGGPVLIPVSTAPLPPGWQVAYVPDGNGVQFATPPANAATVIITYPSPFPLAVFAEDAADIAAHGLKEAAYHAKDVSDATTALALAQGMLDIKNQAQETVELRYSEEDSEDWLDPGMFQQIERALYGCTGFYGVETVEASCQDDVIWRFNVRLRKGNRATDGSDQIDELMVLSRSNLSNATNVKYILSLGLARDNPPDTNPGLEVGDTKESFRIPTVEGGLVLKGWNFRAPTDPPTDTVGDDDIIMDILVEDSPGSETYTSILPDDIRITIPANQTTEVAGYYLRDPNRIYIGGERGYVHVDQVGSVFPGSNLLGHLIFA